MITALDATTTTATSTTFWCCLLCLLFPSYFGRISSDCCGRFSSSDT